MIDLQFVHVANALPVALYTTDKLGQITYYNPAAAKLWGREPVIGEEYWCGSHRLYWPDGRAMEHDECPMADAIRLGVPIGGVEAIAERPDGTRYLFTPFPTPILDENGVAQGFVNMLIDVTSARQAEEGKQRLAAIVESSSDAIVSKQLDGTIMSWNSAAEHLFGYSEGEIIGQSVLILIPEERRAEEELIISRIRNGERVEHFETVRRHKSGRLIDISLTVSPIKRADGHIVGASKIARDISERKAAESLLRQQNDRLETLNRLSTIISRDLDLERIVQSVTDEATQLSGADFGAFFYNAARQDGENFQLFTLSNARREAFEKFGLPRSTAVFGATFADSKIVRSDDIRRDPRYGQNPPHNGVPEGHLPVVSYLAVPVVLSSGEVIGGLLFGHRDAGVFDSETETLVSAIAGQAAMALDNARLHDAAQVEIAHRKNAESAKELLLHEIKHRVKNTLATIQALASQTLYHSPAEEKRAFIGRLHSLSKAHDLLTQREWGDVSLSELAGITLKPFVQNGERLQVDGTDVKLSANKALVLTMVLYELATNAVKYGALSVEKGNVYLNWELDEDGPRSILCLHWVESGGPEVVAPQHHGFGSRMIESAVHGEQGAADFQFLPAGLRVDLRIAV